MPKSRRNPIIEVKGVEKIFKLSEENSPAVLKNIFFEVFFGEFVIIFGPSGCGKSTLLNTILGLEDPTTGTVKIREHNMYKMDESKRAEFRRQKFGVVYQQFNWIKSLNVLENIALPLNIAGHPDSNSQKRALQLLKMLGLERFAAHHPHQLSGGQQQRVAIARALTLNPWILLADEPTGNLDKNSAEDIMNLFKDLNEKSKRTIVLVTHNFEYEKYATKVVFMEDGKFIDVINKKKIADQEEESTKDILEQTKGRRNEVLFYN